MSKDTPPFDVREIGEKGGGILRVTMGFNNLSTVLLPFDWRFGEALLSFWGDYLLYWDLISMCLRN